MDNDTTPVVFKDVILDDIEGMYNKRLDEFQIATATLFMDYQSQVNLANLLSVCAMLHKMKLLPDHEIDQFMVAAQVKAHGILDEMDNRRVLVLAKPATSSIQ